MSSIHSFWSLYVVPYWRGILVFFFPIILLPLPVLSATSAARCGYVIIVMSGYWVTEALPIALTGLIPVFAFPLLGLMSTGDLCVLYMKETSMLFIGSIIVAIAVEACNLHRRIALWVILRAGQSPRRLMAGFMITTMFLSMWISNTATTALMVPIVDAILEELYATRNAAESCQSTTADASRTASFSQSQLRPNENDVNDAVTHDSKEIIVASEGNDTHAVSDDAYARKQKHYMRRALLLGVAYSANCGGTGVVTGSSPNLVLLAILSDSFSEPTGLNFASWMAFNIPGMLLCVILAWIWLQFLFMGLCRKNSPVQNISKERQAAAKTLISNKYKALGSMTHHEGTVLTLFIILIFLWFFRAPEFIPGWSRWFSGAFGEEFEVGDATPALLVAFILFVLPSNLDFMFSKDRKGKESSKAASGCLTWQMVEDKVPWGVILLVGGGFAMAEASEKSGLSQWLGMQLASFDVMPKEAIVFVVCLMTAMLTEVTSNTATASILLPVLKEMALNINVNPIYLMLPATVTCSYAFMLPVATPPNAIVFSAGQMKSSDMMKAGFVMNILCVLVITLMINTLGVPMFDLKEMPPWTNSTKRDYERRLQEYSDQS